MPASWQAPFDITGIHCAGRARGLAWQVVHIGKRVSASMGRSLTVYVPRDPAPLMGSGIELSRTGVGLFSAGYPPSGGPAYTRCPRYPGEAQGLRGVHYWSNRLRLCWRGLVDYEVSTARVFADSPEYYME